MEGGMPRSTRSQRARAAAAKARPDAPPPSPATVAPATDAQNARRARTSAEIAPWNRAVQTMSPPGERTPRSASARVPSDSRGSSPMKVAAEPARSLRMPAEKNDSCS